jgi:hypothetical protein
VLLCSACASVDTLDTATDTRYGDQLAVQTAVGTIKSLGIHDRLSSRAIRLPEQPLGEINVFDFQFPANCGAHEFRVYEAPKTQILEYQYVGQNGDSHMIRDYLSGPSPFAKPGLWSAYDHTAGSISRMKSNIEKRGDGMFVGAYSQGLVTDLPVADQRMLGVAYRQALDDVNDCNDTRTLVSASAD